jgi:phage-related protein
METPQHQSITDSQSPRPELWEFDLSMQDERLAQFCQHAIGAVNHGNHDPRAV